MRLFQLPSHRFRHPLARALSLIVGVALLGVMLVFGLVVAGVLLVGGGLWLALRQWNRARGRPCGAGCRRCPPARAGRRFRGAARPPPDRSLTRKKRMACVGAPDQTGIIWKPEHRHVRYRTP